MSISFCCPKCKASFRVSDEHAGKKAKCKKCGAPLQIPSLAAQAEAPPLPEHRASGADAHDREAASAEVPRQTPESVPPPPVGLQTHARPEPGAPGSSSSRVIPAPETGVSDYTRLPWFRKSGIMSILTAVSVFTWCIPVAGAIPILIVCIALATGDIYYCRQASDGGLRTWHRANRWAAFGILGLNGAYLLYLLYRLVQ